MWTLAFVALATPSSAQTFEDAVRVAREQGPTARMGEEDLRIARARKGQSISRLLPQVSASDRLTYRYNNPDRYTFSVDTDADCDPTTATCFPIAIGDDGQVTLPENRLSTSLGLTGMLPISSRSITGVRQAGLSQSLTRIQVDGQDERLVLDLVGQYSELQYAVGALGLYETSAALARETLVVVQARFAAGEATNIELDQAALELDEATLAIQQIERVLPTSLDRLALLGGPVQKGLEVCPFGSPPALQTDLDLAQSTRIESAETELSLDRLRRTQERLDLLPSLTLVGGASWTGNGETFTDLADTFLFDNWYVGATVSLSVFEGGARHHGRREASAAVRKGEIDLALQRDTLLLDDRALVEELRDLAADIDFARRQNELQSREVEAVRSMYFDGGETSFDRYTQSRNRLEQLQLQLLALQRQQQQLAAQRWVSAGHVDALLDHLFEHERAPDTRSACRTVVPTDS